MAGWLFAADVHVGNHRRWGGTMRCGINERCRLAVKTVHRALEHAERAGRRLCVLGDLFDDDWPPPQVIAEIDDAARQREQNPVVLVGNHDMRTGEEGDNALAPLSHWDSFDGDKARFGGVGLLLVPYQAGAVADEYVPRLVEAWIATHGWPHKPNILGIHAGVRDANTPWYLQGAQDSIDVGLLFELAQQHGFTDVVTGNWHNHRTWTRGGVCVAQVGSLCPTGMDDVTEHHGVWDVQARQLIPVVGPRFVKARTVSEVLDAAWHSAEHVFAEVLVDSASAKAAAETEFMLRTQGLLRQDFTIDVVIDPTQVQQQARAAATAATEATSRDEALAAYVGAMPLPDGVDRARVLDRARGYLK